MMKWLCCKLLDHKAWLRSWTEAAEIQEDGRLVIWAGMEWRRCWCLERREVR